MAARNNSASRIHTLFNHLQGIGDHSQVLAVWTTTFAVTETTTKRQALEVTRRLDAIARELNLIRDGMSNAAFTPSLYENAISALEEAISPLLLATSWNSVRQYLTPQNFLAIQFCSEILPDEESVVSLGELQSILEVIEELRAAAMQENIPGALRALLLHHVELIERAVSAYPISGVKALREAAQAGLGELVEAKDLVAEHRNSEEVSTLAKAWKKVSEVADAATKVDKLIQVSHKAWNLIESVWSSAP